MYAKGGCAEDDFIEQAYLAWKVSSKKRIFVGKHPIKPTNAAKSIVEFHGRQLRSLQMHPAQYVRLMSNCGMYILGPEMVASGVTPYFSYLLSSALACISDTTTTICVKFVHVHMQAAGRASMPMFCQPIVLMLKRWKT